MALSVYIVSAEERSRPENLIAELEDGPVYWHLYPYFKRVAEVTGIFVDLYGDAYFRDFTVLEQQLNLAKKATATLPRFTSVQLGSDRNGRKILQKLDRSALETILDTILAATQRAKQEHKGLIFCGD